MKHLCRSYNTQEWLHPVSNIYVMYNWIIVVKDMPRFKAQWDLGCSALPTKAYYWLRGASFIFVLIFCFTFCNFFNILVQDNLVLTSFVKLNVVFPSFLQNMNARPFSCNIVLRNVSPKKMLIFFFGF